LKGAGQIRSGGRADAPEFAARIGVQHVVHKDDTDVGAGDGNGRGDRLLTRPTDCFASPNR
jgi:hypothetical protein